MRVKEEFSGNPILLIQKCLWYLGLTKNDPLVGFIAARVYVLWISLRIGIALEISNQWL